MSTNHYVDNKRLYAEMVTHVAAYKEAKEKGLETPPVSRYIAQCIKLIAERNSTNRNFIGYTYREDMIGDAVENCLRYLHNFNPEKSNNPFAYFTTIMTYAFIRRIDKEKKQAYIKYKSMENSITMNTLVELAPDDQSHFNTMLLGMDMDKLSGLSEKYGNKPSVKRKSKDKGLDKFIGEDNEQI